MANKGLEGFPTKNGIILVVTVTGKGPYPIYTSLNNQGKFWSLLSWGSRIRMEEASPKRWKFQTSDRHKAPRISVGYFEASTPKNEGMTPKRGPC